MPEKRRMTPGEFIYAVSSVFLVMGLIYLFIQLHRPIWELAQWAAIEVTKGLAHYLGAH